MSKVRRPRQDLRVKTIRGINSIVLTNVYTTEVSKGILYVRDSKGCLLAQFAKGEWSYAYTAESLARGSE